MPGRPPVGRVLLGITGSIAAYKSAALAGNLVREGAEVIALFTAEASAFIGSKTIEAITGSPVIEGVLNGPPGRITHTDLSLWADLFLVAPATLNIMAKMAGGLADDAVSLHYAALPAETPVMIAPAMNSRMWRSPSCREVVSRLSGRGNIFIGPEEGRLACGEEGPGRMTDPETICREVLSVLGGPGRDRDLAGRRIMILSGPTRERIDDIRFISNRSSGRMGRALAETAMKRGAEVVFISGPAESGLPEVTGIVSVESAEEMRKEAMRRLAGADIIVSAAAVSDARPVEAVRGKIARSDFPGEIRLERTPDIISDLVNESGAERKTKIFVGFAAETGTEPWVKAEEECAEKGLDIVVANRVPEAFGSDESEAWIIRADGSRTAMGRMEKRRLAGKIWDSILDLPA